MFRRRKWFAAVENYSSLAMADEQFYFPRDDVLEMRIKQRLGSFQLLNKRRKINVMCQERKPRETA